MVTGPTKIFQLQHSPRGFIVSKGQSCGPLLTRVGASYWLRVSISSRNCLFPFESSEFQPGLASRPRSLKFDCFGGQKWQVPSGRQWIPTKLSVLEFERFVLPHLCRGTRSPMAKLTPHAVFNVHFAIPRHGLPVQAIANRQGRTRQARDSLHANLQCVSQVAGERLH